MIKMFCVGLRGSVTFNYFAVLLSIMEQTTKFRISALSGKNLHSAKLRADYRYAVFLIIGVFKLSGKNP